MKTQMIILFTLAALILPALSLKAQTPWQQTSAANVTLEYRVTQDAQNLEVKLTAPTTGWIAVGFNPTSVMRNANIIIGFVGGAVSTIRDDWGVSNTSHTADVGLGGSSDVTLVTGSETDGSTMLHFTLPLDSGDQYDRPLQVGQSYPVILARGANNADNFSGMHADAGNATITLQAPVSNDDELLPSSGSRILGNYPNPFGAQTTIRYQMAKQGSAELGIYNSRGQLVHKAQVQAEKGDMDYLWQPRNLPNGTYTVRLKTQDSESSGRLNLIK